MNEEEMKTYLENHLLEIKHVADINANIQQNSDDIIKLFEMITKLKDEVLGNNDDEEHHSEKAVKEPVVQNIINEKEIIIYHSGSKPKRKESFLDYNNTVTKDDNPNQRKLLNTETYVERGNIVNNVRVINNKVI